MNIQDWFPLGLTGLISLQSKQLSRVFSSITVWKHQFFSTEPSLWSNSHYYYTCSISLKVVLSRVNFRVYAHQLYFSGILMNNGLSACNAGDPSLIPGLGRSAGEGIGYPLQYSWASLVAQLIKNLPTMQETWVRSLGWEDLLRRERLPTSVFWPGEFHGLYSPWGCKELDTTEWLSLYNTKYNILSHIYSS